MKKIILVSLPVLALLGCGDGKKKEKSVPTDNTTVVAPSSTNTSETVNANTNDDVPSVGASPKGPTATPAPTPTPTPTPSTDQGSGKGGDNGSGKGGDDAGQNPGGKGDPTDCTVRVLNFDQKPDGSGFGHGEKVLEQYRSWGVRVEGYRVDSASNNYVSTPATIFDSGANLDQNARNKYTDGYDSDLLTPANHNVLIINERDDGKSMVQYPDDNHLGGKIKFFFDKSTKVLDMEFIDNENDQSKIELFADQTDNSKVSTQFIPKTSDNVVKKLTVDHKDFVRKFKVILNNGGAVDNIRICVKN